MTKRELIVLSITILVIVVMHLFPPQTEERPGVLPTYRFYADSGWIDGDLLLAQCGAAALLGGGVVLAMRRLCKNKQKSRNDKGEE